jgi:ABC-type multidrug transport system ATPase subunit
MAAMKGEKVRLAFERLHYTVPVKGSTPKALLQDIKGEVTSGHVLAILGPSGAGKTTLLNMLTLQQSGGTPTGFINVNGEPLTPALYDRTCAYVEQTDTLWASLTVREHLAYATSLFRPELDESARGAAVDDMARAVGLEDFMDTRAGNEITRGLSSGNKRRLSVALALVKRPNILFLDEPTSGVDSASAVRMMSFLQTVAATQNVAVVCTIHQPPASVFAGFDNTMVLSMGRVAYFGKAKKMGAYLANVGFPPPVDTNPAEFILDLVNKDFTPLAGVRRVLDAWAATDGSAFGCEREDVDGKRLSEVETHSETSFVKQLAVLTDRSFLVARREPLAYLVRLVANFCATLFFGIIYVETREKVQGQINPRTFFLMFCVGIPMQFILVSNYIYHYQWLSLKKEVKDGMYHPVPAAVASWVVQAPMMFVLALSSLLPMYVIGDLAWSSFGIVLVLYALTFWSFEGLAQMLSTFSNVIIGLFGFLNLYFAAFLFCGMFVDPEDVVWPIRTFCYFMPLGWTLQSYMYALMHDMPDHEGTVACTPGDALPTGGVCTDQGFYCYSSEDPTGAVCYGKDGDTILESLSVQFTIFEAKGHYARNIALIVAFGALTRIGYVAAIYVLTKMYGGQAPGAPGDDVAVAMGDDDDDSFNSSRSSETNPGMPHSKSGADIKLSVAEIEAFDAAVDAKDGTGVEFAFKNICYSIAGKKKDEPDAAVLRDVSGSVREGEILAIVGPSGAGKTILLDTLTFNKGPGAPSGEISLNGKKMTRSDFAKDAIYVPREDNLWPTMSPRQHVEFAFKMYRSDLVTKAARDKEVDELLSVTGLTSCADTKAGGFLFKGLSGGQRRRLSLAVALVKQPSLIVLDEPTSGLDSAAAAAILTLLARVARSRRAAVICTIHQPSALVFAGFHKVLVLSGGRVAYCGPRKEMAAHFESVGAALSHDANPAEAVLDLVSKDTTSEAQVTAVLDGWETSERRQQVASEASGKHAAYQSLPPRTVTAGGASSVAHVFARQARLALVDPLQYVGRVFVIPQLVAFFGLVYLASRKNDQKQVPFRLFYLWWVLALPACMSITTLIGTNRDTFSVVYELRAGMYKIFSYVMSGGLVQIPALFVLSLVINLAAFAVGNWPWDNFMTFVVQFAITLWVYDSMAQLMAVSFKSPVIGMLAFLGYWSSSIVFCGLVFKATDVVWPFRLFYYVLPLKWTFNASGYDVYMPSKAYKGASICDAGADVTLSSGAVVACPAGGFYCDGAATSFGCWGATGEQVLNTLSLSYESLGTDDDRGFDIGILMLMGFVLKLAYVAMLWRAVAASDEPRKIKQ